MNAEVSQNNQPIHNHVVAVADRFAGQLLRASLDALQTQRTLWPVTPQQEQQATIDRLRSAFTKIIMRQMHQVAAAGLPSAEVGLDTITAKGAAIKAIVTIGDNKTLHDLVDAIGRKVVLVLVDAETYTVGMESFEAQKDQPDLPLEGGGETLTDGSQEPIVAPPCSCAVQSSDINLAHEPDCAFAIYMQDDLRRFEEVARQDAERFKARAERGVVDGRSERVKHQDQQKTQWPKPPQFPKPDGKAA